MEVVPVNPLIRDDLPTEGNPLFDIAEHQHQHHSLFRTSIYLSSLKKRVQLT